MKINHISGQEEQINEIIERIFEISGKTLPVSDAIGMIGKVILLRENGSEEITIRKQISGVTGIGLNDPRINEILFEIAEKPAQNTYLPFNIGLLVELKKKLDKNSDEKG